MFEWVWSKMGQAALNKVRNKLFSMRYNCKKAKIYLNDFWVGTWSNIRIDVQIKVL